MHWKPDRFFTAICVVYGFVITLCIFAIAGNSGDTVFLPTATLQLLRTMQRARPQHMLVAADFDALPDVKIAGTNAPLVSETVLLFI